MRTVRTGLAFGLIAQLVLILALAGTVSLGPLGALVGIGCGLITNLSLAHGLRRAGAARMGPADRITLARATLVGGIAALIADSLSGPISVPTLVTLSGVALVLDAVDGWVARRTGTVSPLGARFDMEVDAFLILVLSVYVFRLTGDWWVLAIGAARYLFVAVGWLQPWLRGSLPPRYWRKVVAAVQGIVLTIAAADLLPGWLTNGVLAVSLAMLAESFGRDVWWLWRRRGVGLGVVGDPAEEQHSSEVRAKVRAAAAVPTTALAVGFIWFALIAPNHINELTPAAFLRIPLEGLLVAALVLVLPARAGTILAVVVGGILGILTLLKVLDIGFFQALDRPFNPVTDWGYLGSAVGLLGDTIGRSGAIMSVVVAVLVAVAVLVLMPLAVLRLTRLTGRHRSTSIRSVTTIAAVWVLSAILGVQVIQGEPFASTSAARLTYDQVNQIRAGFADQQAFALAVAADPFDARQQPVARPASPENVAPTHAVAVAPVGAAGGDLLTGLRGKDVIIAFVESYGRISIQDSSFAPGIAATLDAGTGQLQQAGFASRSGFLNSPTFGGLSWLAHSTLQSGLRIDNEQRYDQLIASDRVTLTSTFKTAGWRTVADVPSNEKEWPEGASFYSYDRIYDRTNSGYQGPSFSYAEMTDQYVMSSFQRTELAPTDRGPVMAEIDLVSSHWPWAPLPRMVDWADVGDGSIFDGMPEEGQSPDVIAQDPAQIQAAYGKSIQYSLTALITFVQNYGNDTLVLIMLGDHEPASSVSGAGTTHDVPISIVAHDPAVMARIAGWGWQDGLRPGPQAPVWPMEDFRDRFLTAYGS